jgi:hypothetical protein
MAVTISDSDFLWLKRNLTAMRNELHELKQARQSETWVKAKAIIDLTGWDGEGMRIARERGYIKFKEEKPRVFEYLLESLPPQFYKKTA